jgi:predicted acyl esterase
MRVPSVYIPVDLGWNVIFSNRHVQRRGMLVLSMFCASLVFLHISSGIAHPVSQEQQEKQGIDEILSDLTRAKEHFQKLLDANPDDQDSRRHLAGIYLFENYDKREYLIPMRDGVKLHTQVYTPKDKTEEYPILFTRTPYYAFYAGDEVLGYFSYPGPAPRFQPRAISWWSRTSADDS